MPSAVAAAFATAQGMIDRIHRLRPRVRPIAHVPLPARFSYADIDVIEIPKLPDRRPALALHAAHLAAGKNDDRIFAFLRTVPSDATGGANQLPALSRVHFNIVNLKARRNVRQRHRVADFRRRVDSAHDRLTDPQTVWREDVALLAIGVLDQRDVDGAVGIVLDRDDLGRHAVLGALEVDDPIQPLVAAAAMLGGDHAVMIAAVGAALADGERLLRLAAGEQGFVVDHRSGSSAGCSSASSR